MELTARHREYWHKNLVITAILLFIWFVVTFVEGWYARELNAITFLGFPLGFYMSAQGSLIVYVVLIWVYYTSQIVLFGAEFVRALARSASPRTRR